MRRYSLAILAILLFLGGCASTDRNADLVMVAHSGLLFDRYPGYPTASEVAWHRDWPATNSIYAEPETLYYRETVYDVQGTWPRGHDYTYRRFELQREGFGIR